ncbi:Ankyrin-2 [Trapelia coarctata]|nr:Ankyrin-2 [Trapelia coarctata]
MDGLTLAASIAGLVSVAQIVVEKGYRYLKAVKNCEDEVRKLILETNVFCGIIERLARFAEDEEEEDGLYSTAPARIPDHIYACQKTLNEILSILRGFERKASRADSGRRSPYCQPKHRLTLNDLKWPLSRSRTLELISDLERHKSTCILALSTDEMTAMHSILEQANVTQKIVTEIRSKQKNKKVREAIDWLSPVNPEVSHQAARNLRQQGTGRWFFDLPEYSGAGKTILASLVVDEVSAVKQAGLAYFYCDYRNAESQKPINILGSLIAQLSLQNPAALKEVLSCYSSRHPEGKPSTRLDESETYVLLKAVSQNLGKVTLIIDGLDECGSSVGVDRREFLFVAAKAGSLRIRDESLQAEIIEALIRGAVGMFQWVRCQIDYLGGLPNNRERRKALEDLPPTLPATYCRILERIHSKYPPQTQTYIQRIFKWLVITDEPKTAVPNWHYDFRSLEHPDTQTNLKIQALAQAICIEESSTQLDRQAIPDESDVGDWCGSLARMNHSTQTLELSHYTAKEFLLSKEDLPSASAARKYLVNRQRDLNYVTLTCLTFLSLDGLGLDALLQPLKVICSGGGYEARRLDYDKFIDALTAFKVEYPFYDYSAESIFDHLQRNQHTNEEASPFQRLFSVRDGKALSHFRTFRSGDFYSTIVSGDSTSARADPNSIQVAASLLLAQTIRRLLLEGADPNERIGLGLTPLHCAIQPEVYDDQAFATEFAQFETDDGKAEKLPALETRRFMIVESLLFAGANINAVALETDNLYEMSPLCLAILYERPAICKLLLQAGARITPESEGLGEKYQNLRDFLFEFHSFDDSPAMEEVLAMIQRQSADPLLHAIIGIKAGNGEIFKRSLCVRNGRQSKSLSLDLMREDQDATCTYAEYLADHVPIKVKAGHGFARPILTSQCHLASNFCPFEGKDDNFTVLAVKQYKLLSEEAWHILLDEALDFSDEEHVRSLVCTDVDLYGQNADIFPTVHLACMAETSRFLEHLLGKGADSNLRDNDNDTPLIVAAKRGQFEYVQLLIRHNADVNLSGNEGWTALHHAAWVPAPKIVETLVENGANIHAKGDDGSNALHLAAEVDAVEVATFLIAKGIESQLRNRDNNSPLHSAVVAAFEDMVDMLLNPEIKGYGQDVIDEPSAVYGTPLYAAAKRGSVSIVRKLLDAGADIDKAALPGNILGPPLFAACAHDQRDVTELLLSRGAKTEAAGCQYRTALEVSKAFAQWRVEEILENWEHCQSYKMNFSGIGGVQEQSNSIDELENDLSSQISDLKMLLDKELQLAPSPAGSAVAPGVPHDA